MAARRRGDDVIDLSMGNPDGPTPKHIVDKLVEASQRMDTHGYSVSKGIPRLRKAICDWYQRRYGVELDPDAEAIVTIGSKEGLAHLMLACLERGDTVLVPNPSYPIHIYGAIIAGADIRSVRMTPGVDFFAELERAIRELTPKPKMLILGFPSNPTAQCVELSFFEKIIALARQHDILVVHDLAYADIVFDDYKAPSIMQVPGAREVAVEFFTMSKSYNMAGWRIGFMVGNRELVHALARIKSYHDYGSFTPIQVASIVALDGPQECVEQVRSTYEKRRNVMVKALHDIGWMVEVPKASMYIWAKIPDLYAKEGSIAFAKRLIEQAKIAVAPGVGFGDYGDDHVRIALIENEHRLRQAVRGIRDMFRKDGLLPGRRLIHPKPATLEGYGVRLEPLSRRARERPRRSGEGRQAVGAVVHQRARAREDPRLHRHRAAGPEGRPHAAVGGARREERHDARQHALPRHHRRGRPRGDRLHLVREALPAHACEYRLQASPVRIRFRQAELQSRRPAHRQLQLPLAARDRGAGREEGRRDPPPLAAARRLDPRHGDVQRARARVARCAQPPGNAAAKK